MAFARSFFLNITFIASFMLHRWIRLILNS